MSHSHQHKHEHASAASCEHHPKPTHYDGIFKLAISLNISFVLAEFIAGFVANSTALIADAGHNLSDVLGLLIAWMAHALARRKFSQKFTYGLRSSSILAALINAMILLFACGGIVWEALRRLQQPQEVASLTVIFVAILGIIINGFSAWLFMRDREHDLNMRGAYLHMLADTLVSLGVVAAGILMSLTGWNWLDPIITLVIVCVILWGTWGLFKESLELTLQAVPSHINFKDVADFLRSQAGVKSLCDLHIWALSTSEAALTADLHMEQHLTSSATLTKIRWELSQRFKIQHITLQLVDEGSSGCPLSLSAGEGVTRQFNRHSH